MEIIQKKYAAFILYTIFFWYVGSPLLKTVEPINGLDLSQIVGAFIVLLLTKSLFTISFGAIPQKLLFSVFIFLTALFVNVFTGPDYLESFLIFFRIYGGMCILVFFYCIPDKEIIEKTQKFIVIISTITALYTIFQFVTYKIDVHFAYKIFGEDSFLISFSTVRPRGLINSAGGSASIMSLGIIIFIHKLINDKLIQRDKFVAIVILCGLLLNLTRTFIFSLCIFSILIFFHYGEYKKFVKIMIASVLVFAVLFLYFGGERFLDRLNDIPIFSSRVVKQEEAFMGRNRLMQIPLNKYKNVNLFNKIIGNGLAWSTNQIKGYYIRFFPNRSLQASTHNDFVWLLCNVGLMGLFAYLFFCWAILITYKFQLKFFFVLYVSLFVFLTGIGGETINITGHRYLQFLYIACLFNEGKCQSYIH